MALWLTSLASNHRQSPVWVRVLFFIKYIFDIIIIDDLKKNKNLFIFCHKIYNDYLYLNKGPKFLQTRAELSRHEAL